jgi:Asp-tRNA(Asn)/Glu-tRNA(Gln) amidotransferase A subunit family amidase
VKDGIAVKGLQIIEFTSVSTALEPHISTYDSIPVERLRKAGAIIAGVNIMPGQGVGPGMPDLEHHPRNPWDLQRAPGSSSAGPAAAAAAAMVPLVMGGDGGGSTRLPAALSGVFGLHTTPGRIAAVDYGTPNIALLDGSRGPMAHDVRDAAIMMQVVAGSDGRDPLSTLFGPAPDYLADLDKGVEGMRFAWTDAMGFASEPPHALPTSPGIITAVREAAMRFGQIGAMVERTTEVWESFWPAAGVTRQGFGGMASSEQAVSPDHLRQALDVRGRNWDRFAKVLTTHDLLLMPTATFTAYTVEDWDRLCHSGMDWWQIYTSHTFMFNWLGMPAASVPCGLVDGLPIGLQIVGPPHSEPLILRAAAAFTKSFGLRERPNVA